MSKHWGEMQAVVSDTESGIAALEREQIIKPRPMELEGPALMHPSNNDELPISNRLPIEHTSIDSTTSYTIQLHQYARKVKNLINSAYHQIDNQQRLLDGDPPTLILAPVPQIPDPPPQQESKHTAHLFSFVPKDTESRFVAGVCEPPPRISEQTARQLLRMSVSALSAHIGYETTTESVLDTFADVAHEFMGRITRLLRAAVDRQRLTRNCPFPDAIEQVYHEIGFGSIRNIQTFYQHRVLRHRDHVHRQCVQLRDEYARLHAPPELNTSKKAAVMTHDFTKVKVEPGDGSTPVHYVGFEDIEDFGGETEVMLHLDDLPELEEENMLTEAPSSREEESSSYDDVISADSPYDAQSEYAMDVVSPQHAFQRPAKRSRRK